MICLRNRTPPVLVPALALAPAAGAALADDAFDTTRALLERWVETRKAIATEKRDWTLAKEMLEDRAELVRGEIAAVEAGLEEKPARPVRDRPRGLVADFRSWWGGPSGAQRPRA